MSTSKRYILHSGSRDVPNRQANRIVAMRPADSWIMERIKAAVGEAEESPTPTLDKTARDERSPAMELEKACRESFSRSVLNSIVSRAASTHINLISARSLAMPYLVSVAARHTHSR